MPRVSLTPMLATDKVLPAHPKQQYGTGIASCTNFDDGNPENYGACRYTHGVGSRMHGQPKFATCVPLRIQIIFANLVHGRWWSKHGSVSSLLADIIYGKSYPQ